MNRFAKFAWGVTAWNVLNIVWGAFVRASGSGAGCGSHWPTCNGEVLPTPESIHTVIEFTHRAMSGVALLLVLGLLIWGWRSYGKGDPIRVGVTGSAIFILIEAGLGAGLVLLKLVGDDSSVLRAIYIALHLLNTFILLTFLSLTAWWASGGSPITLKNKGYLPLLFGIGIFGVTLIGMSGAITALGDTLFPAESLAHGLEQDRDPNAHFLVQLRVYHPIIAVLFSGYTLTLVGYLRNKFNGTPRKLAILLGAVVVTQLAMGVINLLLLAPIATQLIHLFIADVVWISYILLAASILSIHEKPLTEETA
jgi:heme A synthase